MRAGIFFLKIWRMRAIQEELNKVQLDSTDFVKNIRKGRSLCHEFTDLATEVLAVDVGCDDEGMSVAEILKVSDSPKDISLSVVLPDAQLKRKVKNTR
jgi:hypothetical protein